MTSIRKEMDTVLDLRGLKQKAVCLTLDVESDYAGLLDQPSYEGLSHVETLVQFLKKRGLPLTCFVQGSLFETHPHELTQLAATGNVEFELHSYSHNEKLWNEIEFEVERGREAYKKFMGRCPIGYRSPLGVVGKKHFETLSANDFKYDSSVFPSIRPGVFQNLDKPTTPYLVNSTGIIEFPFTVFSNIFRVTIGLSYIRLLGRPYLSLLRASKLPSFIVFGFHLHDLFELKSSDRIPLNRFSPVYRIVFNRLYRRHQKSGLATLDNVVNLLTKKGYRFLRLGEVYNQLSEKHEPSKTTVLKGYNR